MPAITPASWLLAMTCAGGAFRWPAAWRRSDRDWNRIVAVFIAIGIAIGAIGYPVTALVLKNRQQVKKAAAEINAVVPANEELYAVNPDYQPVFFYVEAHVKYVTNITKVPMDARYFIVRASHENEASNMDKWRPIRAYPVARVRDYSKREMVLFKVAP
jgi:hypothetical protein